ncbi:MAG: hypothetical protein PHU69_14740 [Fermentimonas sp.]|nr:hypothetical protein [Fermentimonas sp.]
MKVKVIQRFADKNDFTKVNEVGTVLEIDDERGVNLIARKLVEKVENKTAKPKSK